MTRDIVTFCLRQEHIDLLEHVSIRWSDVEYGGPGVDEKRPFGNSGSSVIERKICDCLDVEQVGEDRGHAIYDEEGKRDAIKRYEELDTALQIVLSCQTFTPGVFEREKYGGEWSRVAVEHGGTCPGCEADVSLSVAGMYGEWICENCGVTQYISADA